MTGRTPACEDSVAIGERLREIQAERMARIAGCACGTLGPAQHDVAGNLVHAPQCPLRQAGIAGCQCPPDGQGGTTHRPGCPLEPRPAAMPSQMELATEALWRARARLRTRDAAERYVEHIERAIAAKVVRLWVLS